MGKETKTNQIIKITDEQNIIYDDPAKTSSLLNHFFTTIPQKLSNEHIEYDNINMSDRNRLLFANNYESTSCFLEPVTVYEIFSFINQLKTSNACGHDGFSNVLAKKIAIYIADPLCFICNLSLSLGIVPTEMKKAIVIPIHKGGASTVMSNYRPISLLPVFSKILEKTVKKQILSFLTKTNLFSNSQFGFRENLNTEDALLCFLDKVYDNLNKNMKVAGLFLDITKAFDTVNHSILLDKLYNFGIRGVVLKWFESYLSNRSQSVKVQNVFSELLPITIGVPQGSVLGPILFLIYINSIFKITLHSYPVAFADDTAYIYSSSNWSETLQNMQNDLVKLRQWFNAHHMIISQKSRYMVFHQKTINNFENNLVCHSINCASSACNQNCFQIERVSNFKYLGITLDEKLKFSEHVNYVMKKMRYSLRTFYHLRSICPQKILKLVYFTLFNSKLEYGLAAWGGVYYQNLKPIIMLQKYAIRLMFFKKSTVSSFPLFKLAQILPFRYRYVYKVLRIFYTRSGFANVRYIEQYNLRTNNRCIMVFTRKEYYRRFYSSMAPYLYNLLPDDLKSLNKFNKFVADLKVWLFNFKNIKDIEKYF